MTRYHPGMPVRVVGVVSSPFRNCNGVILQVVERDTPEGVRVQECEVDFGQERRWFSGVHLTISIPPSIVRFFRNEAAERWKELSLESLETLDTDREQLIMRLQHHYGFVRRRAEAEVDTFISEFSCRLERARESTSVPLMPPNREEAA